MLDFINAVLDQFDEIARTSGRILGTVAFMWVSFDRLAKLTPTEWDNRVARFLSRCLYYLFAVLGARVPDILRIDFKKAEIVTVEEAKAAVVVEEKVEPEVLKEGVENVDVSKS